MNGYSSGRVKPWNRSMYNTSTSLSLSSSSGPWKSSMSAISFGFVATAILISMFLIMAIFEHLFRPQMESTQMHKLGAPEIVVQLQTSDFSVVMPGHHYPTFIAQPAPLISLPREGPSHTLSHLTNH